MVDVLITIDTEAWPLCPNWREDRLKGDLARDIDGQTSSGAFGLGYQLDILNRHRLKAVFLVETLFTLAAGTEELQRIVRTIREAGHEVQLHLHTEWLSWADQSPSPGPRRSHLKDFSLEEQTELIGLGYRILKECGATSVLAFRAGNYGANTDTLRALSRNGIRYDTSHNTCYLDSDCGMKELGALMEPSMFEGVCEVPISFFRDWPGHCRHAQLCACSAAEMRHALMEAWHAERRSFVIVSHSFELLRDRHKPPYRGRPDWIVIRRFERLCEFLAEHRDKFRTCGFEDVGEYHANGAPMLLRSGVHRTAWRMAEQLARRVL
jgi:peptidoglycan/xylan/chitin deacetylase (PgdA/CDA1 family)